MPHNLKKTRKMRGSRTQGYGRVTQHRKSGSRGGKGKAGGHKHHWLNTVKYNPNRFRHIGFKPPSSLTPAPETINTGELESLALRIYSRGGVKPGEAELDLTALGYEKLLGKGDVRAPFKIKVSSCTPKALEKVEAAGGEVVKPE